MDLWICLSVPFHAIFFKASLVNTGDMISSQACHCSMVAAVQSLNGRARSCSIIERLPPQLFNHWTVAPAAVQSLNGCPRSCSIIERLPPQLFNQWTAAATIRIGREILCLPYAGFFLLGFQNWLNIFNTSEHICLAEGNLSACLRATSLRVTSLRATSLKVNLCEDDLS